MTDWEMHMRSKLIALLPLIAGLGFGTTATGQLPVKEAPKAGLKLEAGTLVHEVRFVQGGKALALHNNDGKFRVFDAETGALRGEVPIGRPGNTHAFHLLESPDSKQIVVAGSFEKAYVISLDEVKVLKEFPMSMEHAPATFALADKGATLVRLDRSLAVTYYDLATGKVKEQEPRPKVPEGLGGQWGVRLAPDAKTYATGDGKLRDFATHELRYEIKLDTNRTLRYRHGTYRPLFSSDGKIVAINGSDGSVRIVDVASGKELRNIRFEQPERPVGGQEQRIISPLALSGNGRWLLVGGDETRGDYQIFGVASGLEVRRFAGWSTAPFWNSFALSETGDVMAIPKLATLELWDTAKAEPKPPAGK